MGDINQINDVAAANINQVNDVAKANINEVNDQGVAASGATQWAVTAADGHFLYAANSDLTSWTRYDSYDEGSNSQGSGDGEHIGYGKDSNGAGIYIATRAQQNGGTQTKELHRSGTDITSTSEWTNIDVDGDSNSLNHIQHIQWGARSNGATAGTWIAVGKQASGDIFRSIDGGANWSAVDISGLTGHSSGNANADYLNGVASNGAGAWMFAQDNRIYYSTDDGASWAVSVPNWSNNESPGKPQGIVFTNNSWVLCYSRQSAVRFRSCAASDITDWGDEVDAISMSSPSANGSNVKIAAANGNVVACSEANLQINRFTVDGKTIGTVSKTTQTGHGTCKGLATDGTTWIMACTIGDLIVSTDNGANWTQKLDAFQADGSNVINLAGVAGNVFYPL